MNKDALLIGFDDSVNLTINLDYKDNEKIYIKLGNVTVLDRGEFDKLLNFLRLTKKKVQTAKIGKAQILSPKSMAASGHVWLFENGTLKITFGRFAKTLTQEAYFIFLQELEVAKNNLIRYDKIKNLSPEARSAMGIDEAGRPQKIQDVVYKARVIGYSLAVIIFFLNTFLLCAALFNIYFIPLVMAIYLILVDAYLLLPRSEKKAIAMFRANAKDYINEDMLKNLDNLPVSRKGIEFFIILMMVMVFMTAYFSTAIPQIMDIGKKLFGGGGATENVLGIDDIMKTASMFKKTTRDDFDVNKKLRNNYKTIGLIYETASKYRITMENMKFEHDISGGFFNMIIKGVAMTNNPANFNNFRHHLARTNPFRYCDGTRNENRFTYDIGAKYNMTDRRYYMPMKPRKSNTARIRKMLSRAMKIFTGEDVKILTGITTKRKGINIIKTGVQGSTDNYNHIIGYMRSIENEPEVLQVLGEEFNYIGGKYHFKIDVTCIFR